jgi:hypothetical protein
MDFIRQLPLADYLRIKQAWRDLVKACGGPEKVAELTRAGNRGLICQYGQPHCMDRFSPLDVVMDLEAECGVPYVTRILADMLGLDVVARVSKPSTETLQALTGRMAKEFGEAADECLHDEQNADETIRELRDLAEIVNTLIATLTTRHTLRAVG